MVLSVGTDGRGYTTSVPIKLRTLSVQLAVAGRPQASPYVSENSLSPREPLHQELAILVLVRLSSRAEHASLTYIETSTSEGPSAVAIYHAIHVLAHGRQPDHEES